MTFEEENKRERCTIDKVLILYDEDHRAWECHIGCDAGGSYQAFAALFDNEETVRAFGRAIAETFGVQDVHDILGKQCWALRSFGYNNDAIEGLEAENGKRFTRTGWLRAQGGEHPSPLERERARLLTDVAWAERRAAQARRDLETLESRYTDWGST